VKVKYSRLYGQLIKLYSWIPYTLFRGFAFAPVHVTIEVTYNCNLRCDFCQFIEDGVTDKPKNFHPVMTGDEIRKRIDEVPRRALISFTGGEAFTRKDFIDLLEYACRKNKCEVITNGTMITPQILDRLSACSATSILSPGLVMLSMSLEGPEPIHDLIVKQDGAFKRAMGTLRELIRRREEAGRKYPLFNTKMVVTRENTPYLAEFFDQVEEAGADILNLMVYHQRDAHLQRMLDDYKATFTHDRIRWPDRDLSLLSDQLDLIREKSKNSRLDVRITPGDFTLDDILAYYGDGIDLSQYYCVSLWSKMAISAYGEAFPSCQFKPLGAIGEKTLSEVWNGQKIRDYRNDLKSHRIFEYCLGCCNMEKK
jgi:MoaA/NifB/PqqE/SkfB family radical SAM enzyme